MGDLEGFVRHNDAYERIHHELLSTRVIQQVAVMEVCSRLEKERREREAEIQQRRALEDRLALTTLQLASQLEIMTEVRNELQSLAAASSDPYRALAAINERLRDLPCTDVDWMRFEREFTELHPEFLASLVSRYPTLTKQEIKMCQLTRVGLTSLEIAKLLCLSDRSVESHRYNIRRKLGLKTKDSLHEVLASI